MEYQSISPEALKQRLYIPRILGECLQMVHDVCQIFVSEHDRHLSVLQLKRASILNVASLEYSSISEAIKTLERSFAEHVACGAHLAQQKLWELSHNTETARRLLIDVCTRTSSQGVGVAPAVYHLLLLVFGSDEECCVMASETKETSEHATSLFGDASYTKPKTFFIQNADPAYTVLTGVCESGNVVLELCERFLEYMRCWVEVLESNKEFFVDSISGGFDKECERPESLMETLTLMLKKFFKKMKERLQETVLLLKEYMSECAGAMPASQTTHEYVRHFLGACDALVEARQEGYPTLRPLYAHFDSLCADASHVADDALVLLND